ncbi:hypothetical protein ACH4CE_01965 [Streptomyces gelaticus]|uniref:hypothetical protein n=1 Tax=Streptomyces gelaticus TaxID=285446 RepID=UPI003792B6D2
MPTTVPPDGGPAAPAPPGSPHPSPSASGSPVGSASASPSQDPLTASNSGSGSGAGSDEEPPRAEVQSPLAGREAGEGRLRPGRQFSPWELAHADSLPAQPQAPPPATDPGPIPPATPGESAFPGSEQLSQRALGTSTVRQVKQVSLGAGIALIGLGLGFLAFRLRHLD